MSRTTAAPFGRATQIAAEWLRDVAKAYDTHDEQFAYRVLRAWLHTLRDRLTVTMAAHFAAQLPELWRGVYYDGWNPHTVPVSHDILGYIEDFADQAGISAGDVPKAAAIVRTVVASRTGSGVVTKALDQFPLELRDIFR
ncbi:DUF2267 domain-containing protein [Fodinicola acaciae]|uniref:DUF2267 domain-containing protein n=1 Tax=Fodinicola acaciae TaxID=2681555 RepID=UPI0013D4C6D6|nr:DUF2267 domain-containing protein [Fodinicola acaciae]